MLGRVKGTGSSGSSCNNRCRGDTIAQGVPLPPPLLPSSTTHKIRPRRSGTERESNHKGGGSGVSSSIVGVVGGIFTCLHPLPAARCPVRGPPKKAKKGVNKPVHLELSRGL